MVLMLIVSVAILVTNISSGYHIDLTHLEMTGRWHPLFLIGIGVALSGLIFEAIADRQLADFVKNKKPGEIFTTGLYRYSRHPNYFGESIFWLGISLISLPYSYWGSVSFVVISFLLLFVSGVPLQEARYAGRANWEEYKSRTSVFFPWFPKR
jgi:steroid 5-alpha reductase family enzyme